ncbi:sugar transferase [Acholeplasma sp. OttesenSCG-928-E16]|nr:sugar transferase [Acholeplasma sp. OttesenSCG-928-E16]
MKKFYFVIKFVLDELFSLISLIVLSVVFLVIGVLVKATSKGPVFFVQNRVGKNNKIFKLHKFRTMRIDSPHDTATHLLDNPDQYITKIGKFLRKTSLDELPQLWDIFRGKMSFIGPRPALWNQYDLIEARSQMGISKLKVGLSGYAQTHGRDDNSIEEKVKLDKYYADKFGFIMDCRCFFLTILKVIKREGVVEGKSENEQSK